MVTTLASLVFFALRLLPGDPARLVLGDDATAAELARVRGALHLDEPLWAQYARFLRGLASLDLGESLRRPGTRAMALVAEALGPTAQLAVVGVAAGAVAGVALAVAARAARGCRPRGGAGSSAAWSAGGDAARSRSRRSLTWALAARARRRAAAGRSRRRARRACSSRARCSRCRSPRTWGGSRARRWPSSARAPFLVVASAKGAAPLRVWVVHALTAVAGPITTVVATQLGALLGGAVVLERMFERRGLGTLILEAYATRDLPVLEGAVVACGLLFVAAQGLGSAAHAALDPRARTER